MPISYFAYGSNMLPERLLRRCPSARMVGVARLPDHGLSFSKIGRDGSGKATLVALRRPPLEVSGVVFELARDDMAALDAIEGRGKGYERLEGLKVFDHTGGQAISVTTYLAHDDHMDHALQPFDWYLALVLTGARHAGLPAEYRRSLAATPALSDPEPNRKTRIEALAVLAASGSGGGF